MEILIIFVSILGMALTSLLTVMDIVSLIIDAQKNNFLYLMVDLLLLLFSLTSTYIAVTTLLPLE